MVPSAFVLAGGAAAHAERQAGSPGTARPGAVRAERGETSWRRARRPRSCWPASGREVLRPGARGSPGQLLRARRALAARHAGGVASPGRARARAAAAPCSSRPPPWPPSPSASGGRTRPSPAPRPRPSAGPPVTRALPLSFAQERLWFLAQLEPEPRLQRARPRPRRRHAGRGRAGAVLRRAHPASRVAAHHLPVRGRLRHPARLPGRGALPLRGGPATPARRSARAPRHSGCAIEEALRPFELSRGPLLRARLVRLGEREHELLLTMHHIVSDGWSLRVLVRELCAFYSARLDGQPARFEELPVQYADFSVWQRQWLQGAALESQLAHWKTALAGLSGLELPTDRPRPPVRTLRGARHALALPAGLSRELRALSQREGVTLFMTLLAGFQAAPLALRGPGGLRRRHRRGQPQPRRRRGADRLLRQPARPARRPLGGPDLPRAAGPVPGRRRSTPTPTRTSPSRPSSAPCAPSATAAAPRSSR